mgnify:CR=1 FL=1
MLNKIFDYMEDMGWRVDNFKDILEHDLQELISFYNEFDKIVDSGKIKEYKVCDFERMRDCIGFVYDFAVATKELTEKESE